jgi:hypothetical protein
MLQHTLHVIYQPAVRARICRLSYIELHRDALCDTKLEHASCGESETSSSQRRTGTETVATLGPSCSRGWKAKAQSAAWLLLRVTVAQYKDAHVLPTQNERIIHSVRQVFEAILKHNWIKQQTIV